MTIQHILAPFHLDTESAWLAIGVAETLQAKGEKIALWSTEQPAICFLSYGVNTIQPYQGRLPNKGRLKVIGNEVVIGNWYEKANFSEVSFLTKKYQIQAFSKVLHRLTLAGNKQVVLEYASALLAEKYALPGRIFLD